MTIGLVRHFKVDAPVYRYKMDSTGFAHTQKIYHESPIIPIQVDLGNTYWQICFASTLNRAQETAQRIYNGEIHISDLIVEVEVAPVFHTRRKHSFTAWAIWARLAWFWGLKSQDESRKDTLFRCEKFLTHIASYNKENILIVTHGFFMKVFAGYLLKNKFSGKIDPFPKNGKLYVFTKNDKKNPL